MLLSAGSPAAAQIASTEAAAPKLKLTAEVGFRSEFMANENFAETDATKKDDQRLRLRARLRFGAEYQLLKPLLLGFRLSTGDNSYPSTGWSSLSDDLRRDLIQVDRAFIKWQTRDSALQLRFGIDANPLFTPTELVWDSDVQTAGFGEVVTIGKTGIVIAAGQFMLREFRSSKPDNENSAFLFVLGISYTLSLEPVKLTLGASHYNYTNPGALARAVQTGELDSDFKTNRFDPAGRTAPNPSDATKTVLVDYFSNFWIVAFGLKAELKAIHLSLSAEVAINLGARENASAGAAYNAKQHLGVGGMVRYGQDKEAWDFRVGVGFFRIEADSVVAVYTSDDLQQTNVSSIPIELQVRFPGNVKLVWDTYIQTKIDTNLASNGGLVHAENATKVRTRLSLLGSF